MPERVAVKGCAFKRRGGIKIDPGDGGQFVIEFPKKSASDATRAGEWDKTFTIVFVEDVPDGETPE